MRRTLIYFGTTTRSLAFGSGHHPFFVSEQRLCGLLNCNMPFSRINCLQCFHPTSSGGTSHVAHSFGSFGCISMQLCLKCKKPHNHYPHLWFFCGTRCARTCHSIGRRACTFCQRLLPKPENDTCKHSTIGGVSPLGPLVIKCTLHLPIVPFLTTFSP